MLAGIKVQFACLALSYRFFSPSLSFSTPLYIFYVSRAERSFSLSSFSLAIAMHNFFGSTFYFVRHFSCFVAVVNRIAKSGHSKCDGCMLFVCVQHLYNEFYCVSNFFFAHSVISYFAAKRKKTH